MSDRNVLLLTVDCLRADHVGAYGYRGAPTPHLDQLAGRGARFDAAIAQGPATRVAFPALLSASYPLLPGGYDSRPFAQTSVAEVLQAGGYQTAAFTPNPYLSAGRGYGRGFDHFDECPVQIGFWGADRGRKLRYRLNRLLAPAGMGWRCTPYLPAQGVVERAGRWLQQATSPFFAWLHFMDAHWPYNLRRCILARPWNRQSRIYTSRFLQRAKESPTRLSQQERALVLRQYDQGIGYIDQQIGRLFETLQALGRWDSTLVILTGDHGEEFWEHGGFSHYSARLYDELLRVPLLVRAPGQNGPRRVAAQVRHIDVAPTILQWAGLSPPAAFQGQSLLPLVEGASPQAWQAEPAFSEGCPPGGRWSVSLRRPPWKLICHIDPGSKEVQALELYHLERDPAEQRNCRAEHPAVADSLRRQIIEHVSQADGQPAAAPQAASAEEPTSEAVLDRLRSLGYVD